MTISWLVKSSSASILIFLFITLQISACNSNGSVEPTGLTDISLSWAAPSEREDNQPISLSEIAGYKIYYGTVENDYPNSIDINDGKAEAYTFTSFATGTYYFVLTTFDTEGRESQHSPVVKIVV